VTRDPDGWNAVVVQASKTLGHPLDDVVLAAQLVVLLQRPLGNQDRLFQIRWIDYDKLGLQRNDHQAQEDEQTDQDSSRHRIALSLRNGPPVRPTDMPAIPGHR
jgi:hypothetical protein